MAKRALVITDMLNDFLDPAGALYVGEAGRAIIPFVAGKIEAMRQEGAVIIFLADAHEPVDPEFRRFPPHAVSGTWGAAVIPELTPTPGDHLVTKSTFSGLFGTKLKDILVQEGVTEVHLVGVCTSICVMETARDLDLHGFRVVVYRDGVADLHQEDNEWALERMSRLFGVEVR
ncbi:MAG: cysteine hydrolase family protein [Desulfobacca sp.]|uniref:cysteine hydrolase family protein n=1 Tax=Desulfobacca sp. TaxID=2067990 RepID=UPI00404AE14A